MKKYSKILAVLLAIAMVIPGLAGVAESAALETGDELKTVIDLNLRTKENDRAAPVIYVPRGQSVELLGEAENDYFELEYKGKKGYAHRSNVTAYYGTGKLIDVKLKDEANKKTYKIVKNDVLRSKNLNNALPTVVVERGDEVTHKGTTSNDYFLVETKGGKKGYIYRGDVTSPYNFDNGGKFVKVETVKEVTVPEKLRVIRDDVLRAKDLPDAGATSILQRGDVVTYKGTTNNNWFLVEDEDGSEGYIYRGDVTSAKNYEDDDSEDVIALKEAIENAEKAIEALPTLEDVEIEDKIDVLEAKNLVVAVKDLDEDAEVKGEEVIAKLEAKIEKLEEAKKEEVIEEAKAATVLEIETVEDAERVLAAKEAFDELSAEDKVTSDVNIPELNQKVKDAKDFIEDKKTEKLEEATQSVKNAEYWVGKEDYEQAQKDYDKAIELVKVLEDNDAKDNLLVRLDSIKEDLEQAKIDAMVNQLVIREAENQWSITLKFEEININELDSLTIALFDGDRKIGEQKATEETLKLEQPNLSSPFYRDGKQDTEYWTTTKNLLAGIPDKVVITFELDGETYTVESMDSDLK